MHDLVVSTVEKDKTKYSTDNLLAAATAMASILGGPCRAIGTRGFLIPEATSAYIIGKCSKMRAIHALRCLSREHWLTQLGFRRQHRYLSGSLVDRD
jgi:hypothetical protein